MGDTVGIDFTGNTTVATDEVGGVHFQQIKLIDGTAGSSLTIPGDATNGLLVDVSRVQATVGVFTEASSFGATVTPATSAVFTVGNVAPASFHATAYQAAPASLTAMVYQTSAASLAATVTPASSVLWQVGNATPSSLNAAIVQNVVADPNNSSTTNLTNSLSYTFTGSPTSTLGVAGIQVSLYADKNCKVQVQQAPDLDNHWDLTDTFYYTAAGNFGVTVQAISSYLRVVVNTNNETTSTFRLQTALCPIVEALPRALSVTGHLKIANPVDDLGFESHNTPMDEQRIAQAVRLVGTTFEGTTIDSRFWTTAASGTSAAIAQAAAQIVLTSGTSNGATVTMYSTRRARYVPGHGIRYRAAVQISAGVANNVKRWGIGWGATMPTLTDGALFRMNGTTLDLVILKGPSTSTTISSFNGYLGATYDPGTAVHTYEIYWTNAKVVFVVDGQLLHTHSAAAATWSNTKNFHVVADSVNSDVVESSTLSIRTNAIHRFGPERTSPQYYNLTGAAGTHVLKLGPGTLHRMIFNNTNGSEVTIYDNTVGSLTTIGKITTTTGALGSWQYDCPFFNGLTLVTVGNSLDATVVYE